MDSTHANLRTTTDPDRITTVWLDVQGKSVNTFTPAVLADLANAVSELERANPAGVIFASAKKGRFVAGADLFEIRNMNREQVLQFLADGQQVFQRISRLPMPTAAAIGGDCLGGGFELALACTYRVGANEGSISIGLPEVKLGILPAWGGTTRLPRLIGLTHALPLLLAGKTMPPRKALKAGLIDEVVRPEALLAACKRLLLAHAPQKHVPLTDRVAVATPFLRHRILASAEAQARAKTMGHYPAPLKVIEVVRAGLDGDFEDGLKAEREGLADLMETSTSRNLMRLFFLRQGAKRAATEKLKATASEVKHAAVIGGGTMGAGIVHALIRAGIKVRLIEVDPKAISAALQRIQGMLKDDIAIGRISPLEAKHAFNRVSPATQWTGLHLADIAIEAVIEKMELKREVFSKLDRLCRPDAVLATNTSSLIVGEMAQAALHRERVVGLHFFNPVPKMPLVEIVRAPETDDHALATAAALAIRIGKTPVLVKDAPGFLVNRVLIPYLAEALVMAGEGTPVPSIDKVMKQWGMPMGPFELLDEIGLDVGAHVLKSLSGSLGDRVVAPVGLFQAIERGWLGRKSGRGFYVYKKPAKGKKADGGDLVLNEEMAALLRTSPAPQNGNAQHTNGNGAATSAAQEEAIQWRLVLPMVNEAARLLEEGVTDSVDAIDLATVLGTGLAPFRGGLATFADAVGIENAVKRLDELAAQYGPRFVPAVLLRELAAAHKPFADFASIKRETTEVVTPV